MSVLVCILLLYLFMSLRTKVRVRILAKRTRTNAHVRVRFEFWQSTHVRAMCVRLKIKCANVRACEARNRRNSQFAAGHFDMYR